MRNPKLPVLVALAVLLLMPGCALVNSLVEYPTPTPRPQLALRPTFTPTPVPTDTPAVPTETPAAAESQPADVAETTPAGQEVAAQSLEQVALPTATPEPPAPTDTPTPEPPTPTPEPPTPTPTPTPEPKPEVVVTNPRVNVRSGPGATFPVLGQVLQGERLEIIGRDEGSQWWQICCFQGQTGWLADEVVRAEGPLEAVALAAAPPTPTLEATPTAEAVAVAPPPAEGDFLFGLTEETTYPFSQDYLRVGVKANDDEDTPLAGFYLRVVNETTGQQWLSPATGSGPWRGTAPSVDFADFRQANLIYDTRGQSALAGNSFALWLVDGAGRQVSPVVRYSQDDDPFRWLYVVWTQQ
ncbi:MAG TPA: SH3 domain-containing protein [Anaerolineae bacterium]|nr:SH3 domain-containing protein [Anaerolineae bacterium]